MPVRSDELAGQPSAFAATATADDPSLTHHDVAIPHAGRPSLAEPIVVLVVVVAWFFWGVGKTDFVLTESLRGLVAKEMYEGHHGLVPTVHHRTYLRKLPLHAWTTSALAHAVGRFDEQVARWPSCAMGVIYVMTIYFASRRFIDPGAGIAGAVLAGGNWEVLDYGTRADLDMGVLAMTSLALVLLGIAWQAAGTRRTMALLGCYAAALLGSWWKAPHVLVAVWLTIAGLAWFERRRKHAQWWSFALHPVHVVGSLICLASFGVWFAVLSEEVGTSRSGSFVLLEFLSRVVPHSLDYLTGLILAPLELIGASAPACFLAALLLYKSGRESVAGAGTRATTFVIVWLVTVGAFLLIVPAKAPRYWFLNLGAVTLLGVWVWRMWRMGNLDPTTAQWVRKLIPVFLLVGAACGIALITAGLLFAGHVVDIQTLREPSAIASLIGSGAVMLAAALFGFRAVRSLSGAGFGLSLTLMLLCVKPVHAFVFVPSMRESVRPATEELDRRVPPGVPVYVLSDKEGSDRAGELFDFGYYCTHDIRWPLSIDDAIEPSTGDPLYLLLREEARDRMVERFGPRIELIGQIDRRDKELFLLKLTP